MDWENEPYVRLYTRDTTNWRRFGYEGESVLMALMRKVDRSGAIDLEGMEPWEAVRLHIGAHYPEELVRTGVATLVRLETLAVRGDVLVLPNHIAAQTAVKSDKQRAKESRDRRARGNPDTSQDVMPASRNVTAPSRDVMPASREITERHAESRAVTPRHSLLCSALPNSALPSSALRCGDGETRPPAPALEPGEPEPSDADRMRLPELVRLRFVARYEQHRGSPPGTTRKQVDGYAAIASWLDAKGGDPERVLSRLLEGFFRDPWAVEKGFPVTALANDPPKYFEPPVAAPGRPAVRTPRVVRQEMEARALAGAPTDELRKLRLEAEELERAESARGGFRGR